jgi:hypothetical protein
MLRTRPAFMVAPLTRRPVRTNLIVSPSLLTNASGKVGTSARLSPPGRRMMSPPLSAANVWLASSSSL